MRRLILCVATVAAVSAYNLVIQEMTLMGGLITSDTVNCKNIDQLHIDGVSYNIDCHDVWNTADTKAIESRKVVYTSSAITTKASTLNFEIKLTAGETITFQLKPNMKAGSVQSATPAATYTPLATAAPPSTTTAPAVPAGYCDADPAKSTLYCLCQTDDYKKNNPQNDCDKCQSDVTKDTDPCNKPPVNAAPPRAQSAQLPSNAVISKLPLPLPLPVKPDVAVVDSALPPAVRLRGPGPARPPATRRHPVKDSVEENEEEVRRVKREDPPVVDDNTITVAVAYYVLDEPGNPAAVWAAVIEGIVLIVLVGACLYFFCWAPRNRGVASAAADPYKPEGNYSVSYANSSYNQRIDAFQNPPPAAPPRPANSAYMDDYITDNIGAMGRPAAATTAPSPAATAASAANPAPTSNFEPRHQRFDSSGLVTVNLS